MSGRQFRVALGSVLSAGLAVRAGYLFAQPAYDPAYARPMLDGAYYVDWAVSILSGGGGPDGAFYLAPLYPYSLAALFAVVGQSFGILYLVQHVMGVATAGLLGLACRRLSGEVAGLACASLVLLYHPLLFLASCPVSESLAVLLLAVGLLAAGSEMRTAPIAGLAWGAMSIARPNLLLVPAAWIAVRSMERRFAWAMIVLAAVVVLVVPVAIRNLLVSGHPVPVSSNAGITLYHGNGPGAHGTFTLPHGFSGSVLDQRAEATRIAVARSGEPLDPVEADRWWGRQAIRVRMANPVDTVALTARKVALLVGNREISLAYAPGIDENPWRFGAPVPFAVILALAAVGLVLLGVRGTGGVEFWGTVLAALVTPIVFYGSSRYRLPVAVLLCVPAGAGMAALLGPVRTNSARRILLAGIAASVVLGVSLFIVPPDLVRDSRAGSLANRAMSWKQAGNLARAENDLRRALRAAPDSVPALYNLGVVQEEGGRLAEAETAYALAFRLDPSHAAAAGNLAGILVRTGRAGDAVPVARRALESTPDHRACWTNLVIALVSTGRAEEARSAARDAVSRGVSMDAGLLHAIGLTDGEPGERER